MHLAASVGNIQILQYLVHIKANVMCRDRFNGTPLEDAVRHNSDMSNAEQVQKLLRDKGATLANEGLTYVVRLCEYAAQGNVEGIRLLSENGVDVSLGDYDDRTPLHLAACNGNTAVLEYLLRQESVVVNALDRFGGTPYVDALRHDKKGAAALLEEAGCVNSIRVKSELPTGGVNTKAAAGKKKEEPKKDDKSRDGVTLVLSVEGGNRTALTDTSNRTMQRRKSMHRLESTKEEERNKESAEGTTHPVSPGTSARQQQLMDQSQLKKEARLAAERKPKIDHMLMNSQESKMVAAISDTLSKLIADQSAQIELVSKRLIWALRAFRDRLYRNSFNIPFTDNTFLKTTEHALHLVVEMRESVHSSRSSLMAEMQGDGSAADCQIWRNASKEYKLQALELDDQMRELIMLAKVAKRMFKAVLKVCNRGTRQAMYIESLNTKMNLKRIVGSQEVSRGGSRDGSHGDGSRG